jgi:hypothetical protein
LLPHLHCEDKILVLGNGNSTLCEDLYNDNFKKVIGIDYSQVVTDTMKKRAGILLSKHQLTFFKKLQI